ncbi:ABC transporter ATP-binding protein [Streptomyces sp. NBC_00878]|uniref:ABC transporter ATP-binding protein n=1 Tax=Streptomyces sp. NBC_00878 TaxID=2975854 RepID=UPI0022510250|nr:ABC transporter ATP-binding protein [Streptomyces sp. NBC_00878]MCX4904259.1 ABC transporter ATP-binding protein [Streptomyces sp. NBC_00878]
MPGGGASFRGVGFRGVSHVVGGRAVFERFDLDVPPGSVLAVLGASGAGKSTLLRLAAGVRRPTAGTVSAPGRVGYAFAEPRLLPWRSALENVVFALGRPARPADLERARDLLARLGLTDVDRSYPAELSTGMRQRVSLARALMPGAPLLVLDEPTSALDVRLRAEVRDVLLALAREADSTVLWATHDPSEAARAADRVLVLTPAVSPRHTFLPLAPRARRDAEDVDRAAKAITEALTSPTGPHRASPAQQLTSGQFGEPA